MKKLLLLLALVCASCSPQAPTQAGGQQAAPGTDAAAWEQRAQGITIIRDDWGIPHVYGKTDADAVFGMMYAQAEDDFNRVERNYLLSLGRLAEAEGEKEIYRDLRMKLFIDPAEMKAKYDESPEWLKSLMNAWADGLNYYLHEHPQVAPRVIRRFEPWMALSFTEGSIGGDIESVNLAQLEAFYGKTPQPAPQTTAEDILKMDLEPRGSNGIAIGPSRTATKHAMLLINPHTSFYFRAEGQMVSEEGLNAYGAMTWGQFFIYQGFNDRAGWMHTSSSVDNIDHYLETIVRKGDQFFYRYGAEERPLTVKKITIPYKTDAGMAQKEFTTYETHHGPIIREENGKWVAVRLMEEPIKALTQSYNRTKARTLKEYRDVMDLHTNSSNNTLYANADGDFAYFHSNFIPKRDPKFDWTKPVDGSDPATEWNGVLSFDESPNAVNPASGWAYNTNNWPFSAAGPNSPKKADFPAYVDSGSENARGIHAIMLLEKKNDFTLDSFLAAAFDSYQPAFAAQMPVLVRAWERLPSSNPMKAKLAEQVALLKAWDYRWGADSVQTSLGMYWGDEITRMVADAARAAGMPSEQYISTKAPAAQLLEALVLASDKLTADFGTWKTPWGEINRFQRLTGDIVQPHSDAAPSIPVAFTSGRAGSLASYGARTYPGTKKRYGSSGNSFVAVVEFGDRVRARAVTAGGASGDPTSKHFSDQAERYATGNLREVYFYREQLQGHTEREYHPGK
jgi:acyl-homoserine lactone acylase PvdQ